MAQGIWMALEKWIHKRSKIVVKLRVEEVMLCIYNGPMKTFINTMLLIFKQHIYATKCTGHPVTFVSCLTNAVEFMKIEKIIASRRNKLSKFNKIWSTLDES